MDIAFCGNPECRKLLYEEDKIWQVRTDRTVSGQPIYVPCCSRECADALQKRYIKRYEEQLADIKNQSFQIMQLKNF